MQYRMNRHQIELTRNAAIELFAHDLSNAEIARRLHVARQTISEWHNQFNAGGREALALKKPGPEPKLNREQLDQIRAAILEGPMAHGYQTQLWTLDRITDLIQRLTGVGYHPGHVWYLLGRMDLTCQKPECQAKERDQEAVDHFVNEQWPQIKKGP